MSERIRAFICEPSRIRHRPDPERIKNDYKYSFIHFHYPISLYNTLISCPYSQ